MKRKEKYCPITPVLESQNTYFRRLTIFVIACLMIVPAFSVSFFVKPLVTHTLSAGVGCHPASRGLRPKPRGKDLSRVMSTLFARHCKVLVECTRRQESKWSGERIGCTNLVYYVSKDLILVVHGKLLGLDDLLLKNKKHDGIVHRA